MPFRFVHTADLHLDSPLRSLSLRDAELAELIGDGSRRALSAIIDLAIEEQVDALLIAGDLYDGDQTSMKTARFLVGELERLDRAGIPAFIIRGNHDALSRITSELSLPPSVKVFGGRAEIEMVTKNGLDIAIHGLSFARPQAPESLLPKYRPPVPGAVNIGLMHTSLDGAPGHDPYAPVSLSELWLSGFTYWALGHIHGRTQHAGPVAVVMPGMPQGRDINEAGDKSVSLVTIADDHRVSIEERRVGHARFERVSVDVSGLEEWSGLPDAVEKALAPVRAMTRSPHLVTRLRLAGPTPLAFRMRRDADLLLAEAQRGAARHGNTWVEKLDLAIRPAGRDAAEDGGALAELDRLMRDEIGAGALRADIAQLVRELGDDLPPEIRDFAGRDEAGFAEFVSTLLAEAEADMVARLEAGSPEEAA